MTPAELYAFAGEHLLYEAWMFTEVRAMKAVTQPLGNMRIETGVLHMRNLIDFFYPTPAVRDDDVYAGLFVADWDSSRPALSSFLGEARKRAGKEMNHLTKARKAGTSPDKAWDFNAISADLRAVVKAFLDLKPAIPSETCAALGRI